MEILWILHEWSIRSIDVKRAAARAQMKVVGRVIDTLEFPPPLKYPPPPNSLTTPTTIFPSFFAKNAQVQMISSFLNSFLPLFCFFAYKRWSSLPIHVAMKHIRLPHHHERCDPTIKLTRNLSLYRLGKLMRSPLFAHAQKKHYPSFAGKSIIRLDNRLADTVSHGHCRSWKVSVRSQGWVLFDNVWLRLRYRSSVTWRPFMLWKWK